MVKKHNADTMRKRQAQATKERILETARRLVREHGFDNITVDTICKESGIAKGGFYHHFSSKADIIQVTYRLIDERFLTALETTLPTKTEPRAKIEFTTNFMATEAFEHGPVISRLIYRIQLERGTEFFISPERPFYTFIHESLQEALACGEVHSTMDTKEQTQIVLSLARGIIYDWTLHAGSYNIIKFMNSAVKVCLDGLFLSS